MKVLITPAPKDATCFWCRKRKKDCVTAEFSNGFVRGKVLCFDCFVRATRVQFEPESDETPSTVENNKPKS